MVVNNVVSKLIDLGFSEYEAKTYLTLSIEFPLTSYEIAKNSGIPSSKIYEVIDKLVTKNLINEVMDNEKKKYVPLPFSEYEESYKTKMNSLLLDISNDLKDIKKEQDFSIIWNINEYEYLINKSKKIIENSKNTLLISIWGEDLFMIKDTLDKKSDIKISIVHFGKTDVKIGTIFQHPIEDTIYNEKGGRNIVIVSDSNEVIVGTIYEDNRVLAAYTMNQGMVTMATDYIKHDIYIMKIVNRFNDLLVKSFGENYYKLRDVFSDEEVL